jgi:hypothetical protein
MNILSVLFLTVSLYKWTAIEMHIWSLLINIGMFDCLVYYFCFLVTVLGPCIQLFFTHNTIDTEHWLLRHYAFSYQALEDVEKNVFTLKQTLSGDGEVEPNQEQVLQIALEICKEGVLSLFVQNLPSLGWEVWYLLIDCDVIFTKHI